MVISAGTGGMGYRALYVPTYMRGRGGMMRKYTLVAIIFLMPNTGLAQAFGISMGQKASSLNVVEKVEDHVYAVTPPMPNSEFENYIVIITESHGVCKVSGIGASHKNDRYGSSVRSKFEEFLRVLTDKYGNPQDNFDFIKNGALWTNPDEWVMSIYQSERYLSAFWNDLDGEIDTIGLETNAISSDTSYLSLGYEFDNFSECREEIKRAENKGL